MGILSKGDFKTTLHTIPMGNGGARTEDCRRIQCNLVRIQCEISEELKVKRTHIGDKKKIGLQERLCRAMKYRSESDSLDFSYKINLFHEEE